MKKLLLLILLFISFNCYNLFSNDIIDTFVIDSTSIALIQNVENDTSMQLIPSGSFSYKNGKLSSGIIEICFKSDSSDLIQTSESETYIADGKCIEDDTLRITFDRTFYNSRASKDDPNYTTMAKICYKGFEYTLAFPVKIEVKETFVLFKSNFLIDLKKIYSKLQIRDYEYDEFEISFKIKAMDENLVIEK